VTQKIIPTTAISVQSAKPDTRFGQLSVLPLSNTGYFMCRASLTGIPADATVTSATLQLRSRTNPWSGTRTIKVRAMSGPFSTASTWNQRPGVIPSTEVTLAQTNAAFGAYWNVDLTAVVQTWVSGTVANNGVIVFSAETTGAQFQGVGAAWGAPALIVNYTTAAQSPAGLHPSSGAVSIAKPTLTFPAATDTQSIQVQIDPSANAVTPAFDSGEVAATAGLLDLAAFSSPRTATISTTSGSATITAAGATFTYLDVGQSITGTGIPVGATVTAVASGTSATISANATVTGSPTATITRIYLGLSNGSSTQWRARVKNSQGWSPWSSWVAFSRTNWGTLTITSPTSTSEDPSPVVTATYSGTITAWRVTTKSSTGAVVQDSGWTAGTSVAYGTSNSVGASGSAVVQIRDNVLRDATPGDPDYTQATQAFTVTPSGTPTTVASVTAVSDSIHPTVTIGGTRAAGVPDEVVIYRNGVMVGRVPGASVFTGTTLAYVDETAPMNVAATYTVYAVVNGAWSNASSGATVTPRCIGIWILDPGSTLAALLLGDDDQDQTQPETAIVHRPVSGPDGTSQVVRRRLSRYPREGAVAGLLADAMGVTAAASEAAMRAFADNDAGYVYRLVLGNQNDPVILGDIDFGETSLNGSTNGRLLTVSANWWYQG
jgi:hypothetical protein